MDLYQYLIKKVTVGIAVVWAVTSSHAQWTDYSTLPNVDVINGIDFADTVNGIAVGYMSTTPASGRILRSTNGGVSFSVVKTYGNCYLEEAFFFNKDTGYVCGGSNGKGIICKTKDGGLTWDSVTVSSVFELRSVHFVTSTIGFAAGGSNASLIKTTDGGVTWSLIYSQPSYSRIEDIFFTDALNGYAVTGGELLNNGKILKSTDGGITWADVSPAGSQGFTSVCFVDSINGFVTSNKGLIYRSNNFGTSWLGPVLNNDPSVSIYTDVDFVDNVIGFVCGYDGSQSKVLRTTNSGANWYVNHSGPLLNYNAVCCINKRKIISGGVANYSLTNNTGSGITHYATAHISGYDSLCAGGQAIIKFEFTGVPPWNVTYYGSISYTLTNITATPRFVNVTAQGAGSYFITSCGDLNGSSSYYGGKASFFNSSAPSATLSSIDTSCNSNQAVLKFKLSGCPPFSVVYADGISTYTVSGIYNSTHYAQVFPGAVTTYSLVSVTDLNGTANVTDTTLVYPSYKNLFLEILGDTDVLAYNNNFIYRYKFNNTAETSIVYYNVQGGTAGNISSDSISVNWTDTVGGLGIIKMMVRFPNGCLSDTIYKYVDIFSLPCKTYPFCSAIPGNLIRSSYIDKAKSSVCMQQFGTHITAIDKYSNIYVASSYGLCKNGVLLSYISFTDVDVFSDMEIDDAGNIWISAIYNIDKYDSAGNYILTIGPQTQTTGVADGDYSTVRFMEAGQLEFDSNGYLFVSDGRRIRRIDTSAKYVSTFVGKTASVAYVDGPGTSASFCQIAGMAIDRNDNIFVTDHHRIRKVTPLAFVSTVSGNGPAGNNSYMSKDGPPDKVRYYGPAGYGKPTKIVLDYFDRIYVSDSGNVRFLNPNGFVTTIANEKNMGFGDISIEPKTNKIILVGYNYISQVYELITMFPEYWYYCDDDSVLVLSSKYDTGSVSYLWSNGVTDSSFVTYPKSDTVFNVVMDDGSNMPAIKSVDLRMVPKPKISANPTGDILTSTAGLSYQWFLNGVTLPADTFKTYVASAAGTYQVQVSDSVYGCSSLSDTLYYDPNATGLENVTGEYSFVVSPNPTKGIIGITHSSHATGIRVMDVFGRLIFEQGKVDGPIDISFAAPGIYFLSLQTPLGIAVTKIVKE